MVKLVILITKAMHTIKNYVSVIYHLYPTYEMSIKEILNITKHRPWEIPIENWKFYQEWNNAIFLHWEVELRKFVPK